METRPWFRADLGAAHTLTSHEGNARKARCFFYFRDGPRGRCLTPYIGQHITWTTAPLTRNTTVIKTHSQTVKIQSEQRNFGKNRKPSRPSLTGSAPLARWLLWKSMIAQTRSYNSLSGTSWKRRRNLRRMLSNSNWMWESLRQDVRWTWRKQRPRPTTSCWSGARWVVVS